MIGKQDIIDRAAEWHLRPEIVEKDYVLGWLLAGVASLPIREHWIFKGGTSIKKCYFETYRFSEDLDFSLLGGAAYGQEAIEANLRALAEHVADLSGLQFPSDTISVRARRNKQGHETFEGRIGYRGPLAHPGPPRILFDITQHEPVLDPPAACAILHPYPDELPADVSVQAYSARRQLLSPVSDNYFCRRRASEGVSPTTGRYSVVVAGWLVAGKTMRAGAPPGAEAPRRGRARRRDIVVPSLNHGFGSAAGRLVALPRRFACSVLKLGTSNSSSTE